MRPLGSNAYQHLHKQIVICLVYFCIMIINAVPAAKGISERFAPRELFTGQRLNLNHLKAPFGGYIEASMDADVTNNIKGRTHPCISLGPSGNWQGLQIFFDLETAIVLFRLNITIFPMLERVIKIIDNWVKLKKNAGFNNKLEFWDLMKKI